MKRNTTIDVIKGAVMFNVVICHAMWTEAERLKLLFPFWVQMTIPTLMIISGYLYTKSFSKAQIHSLSQALTPSQLIPKLIRFAVPYTMVYLVEVLAHIFLSPKGIMEILLMYLAGGWGPGTYYIPFMFQFVFFVPFVYLLIERKGSKGLLICWIGTFIYELLQKAYGMNVECYTFIVLRYAFHIAFGCYLALYSLDSLPKPLRIGMGLFGFCWLIILCYTSYKPMVFQPYWKNTALFPAMFIIPIVGWLIEKTQLKCKPLELLGKASFNIYLTQKIFYYGMETLFDGHFPFIHSTWVQCLVNLVLCFAIGILFYYIETPLTKTLLQKIRKKLPA